MEIVIVGIVTLIFIGVIANQAKKNKHEKIMQEREQRQQEVAEQAKRHKIGDFR